MGISPMYMGDTSPPGQFTLQTTTGTPLNLTGLNASTAFTLNIHDPERGTTRTGTGVFTITNATGGVVTYQWSSADTGTLGSFTLSVTVQFATGQETSYPPIPWVILAR